MVARTDANLGNSPRTVIRGVNSHICNEVGVHWNRISFPYKYLADVRDWCVHFWGQNEKDGFGLWSYDSRFTWSCAVTLNFDADKDRAREIHNNKITLEVPGKALDELAADELALFIEGCFVALEGKCTRCDIFFDDYSRLIEPKDLHGAIDRNDYAGFSKAHKKQTIERGRLIHDEVMFGRRGQNGSGKYLRIYDKNLESDGEKNCVRYEVEFSQDKAHKVFMMLAKTVGDIDAFATMCGSLVGGCINFVHRTGEKNLGRLQVYDFWQIITDTIGTLHVRSEKKINTVTGVREWVQRQVSPSLACLRKVFRTDKDFFNWLFDVLDDGDSRMNAYKSEIVKRHAQTLGYRRKCSEQKQENDYVSVLA